MREGEGGTRLRAQLQKGGPSGWLARCRRGPEVRKRRRLLGAGEAKELNCLPAHLPIHPLVYASVRQSIHASMCPSTQVTTHLSICPSIHLSVNRPSTHPSIRPFTHPHRLPSLHIPPMHTYQAPSASAAHPRHRNKTPDSSLLTLPFQGGGQTTTTTKKAHTPENRNSTPQSRRARDRL